MIRLRVHWEDNRIRRFTLSGHAGYANSGEDIVCAAVSALVYNAINTCERFLGVGLQVRDDESLECDIPPANSRKVSDDIQLVLQSMVFGIRQIERQYKRHVSVLDFGEPESNRTRV